MPTLYTLNIPALREEALHRLRQHGSQPFSDTDAHVVGHLLGRRLGHDVQHPLLIAADYDVEYLRVGKYEFVVNWLAPAHEAAAIADTVGVIALHLLGYVPLPSDLRVRFRPGREN